MEITKNLTEERIGEQTVTARRGNRAEDLTGRRFGRLTVQRRAENHKGRTAWACICDCGREKTAIAHDLKAGKVRSCGCLRKTAGKRLDLTGRQFGRLTCLYPTSRRDSKGSLYWRCRCACGKEKEITADRLLHGNINSCGCLKKELQEKMPARLHHIEGTCIEFLDKRKHRNDNKSGFRGVFRLKNGRYRADIGFRGKRFYLGSFHSYEEAVRAREEAEEKIYAPFLEDYLRWKEKADRDPAWARENPFRVRDVAL